ncbi:macrophage mannose receptor 1-like [Acipenser ruthenus]|uniref:macrophage mannose receptor 1-like n=1 Tax=Acipenser ruthenus TaxID=7906 RepID=UPI0027425BDD|nr:macrophage mannose receptor 1-like [Acipenser ruthenus]
MCYQETSNITERYTLIEVLKTWTEAQQYCREHHTDLVSIKDASENEDLVKKAQGTPFWIGLFNEPWKWSHQGDNYTFHYWNTGEPNNLGGNQKCVRMYKSGTWDDKDCNSQYPFFCCVGGSSGQCLYEGTKKTWQDAQSYCRNKGKDLPTIQDQDGVNTLMGLIPTTKENNFWIGLYHDKDNWQWSNGDDVIYSNWRADLFCASVNSDGEWEDSVCSEKKAFMCYSETSNITERYTLIEVLKTWTEAQQYCREHHTDLVSIKNASEDEDLVKKAQGKTFWIGLFNEPWKWSHQGDSYTFKTWASGDPDNRGGNENCVVMGRTGGWCDTACSTPRPSFCCDGGSSGQCFYEGTKKTWLEAQSYCRNQGRDLPTIQDKYGVNTLMGLIPTTSENHFWIGLYHDKENWQWSNGDDVIYSNWRADLFCASVNSDGKWDDSVCSEKKAFMCYNETSNITERYTLIEVLKTWTEAQQYCREHHTDLVSIKDASENEDLVKKAQGTPFWIGLFNEPWKWSHQGDNYTFHYWNTGEPNNLGGNQKCVRMYKSGTWDDKDCNSQYPFFCCVGGSSGQCLYEGTKKTWQDAQSYCRNQGKDLPTIQDQDGVNTLMGLIPTTKENNFWIGLYHDKDNWQWSNGDDVIYSNWRADLFYASVNSDGEWEDSVCSEKKAFMCYSETSNITERYTLIEVLKTWTEAQQYCREHHTDLVSIKDASKNEDLVKKAQGTPFWIGLFNEPWKWSHQGDSYTFQTWASGDPDNRGGNENCVVMGRTGGWCDTACNSQYPFFCCVGGSSGQCFYEGTEKAWLEAQSYCRNKGKDLPTIQDQDGVNTLMGLIATTNNTYFWMGLYHDKDNWQWSSGDYIIYSNWRADLFCASVNSDGEWQDSVCSEKKAFMCYSETSTITERYTLIEVLKTWTEAQQYCREHHTDLVSIKNASENADLVKKAQGKPFWIGLFNEPWKWSHQGDSFTFHYWNNEQPNNAGGNDKCVRMYKSGTWGDKDCSVLYPFFCYDDATPSDPPSTTLSEDPAPSDPPSTRLSEGMQLDPAFS